MAQQKKTKKPQSKSTTKNVAKVTKEKVKEMITPEVKDETVKPNPTKNKRKFALKLKLSTIAQFLLIVALFALFYFKRELFIAAEVNGQTIKRLDLVRDLERTYGRQTLDTLITKALIEQEAKKLNIVVSDEEIDQEMELIRQQLSAQNTDLETVLTTQGISMEDLREQVKIQKIVEKAIQDKLNVTDEEIDQYVSSNPAYAEQEVTPELKDQIREALKQQKGSQAAQAWIADVKLNANIKNYLYTEPSL